MPPRSGPAGTRARLEAEVADKQASDAATMTTPTPASADAPQAGKPKTDPNYSPPIVWRNVILMSALHLGAVVGAKIALFDAQWKTLMWSVFLYNLAGFGITVGVHRLWSHRAYKANFPYRAMLALFNTIAFQNSILEWARDHRVHHKFAETDADPHNIERGFFFAHMGWLLSRKHPEVKRRGAQIDLSDLLDDPIVMFQHKYYLPLVITFAFVVPTLVPHYLWGESLFNAFYVCALLRYTLLLHLTWLINSAAHYWGRKPFNSQIWASESPLANLSNFGEGFHNFHHTFPWDYAISEFGYVQNMGKLFIDAFALIGWTWDRKLAPPSIVRDRLRDQTSDKQGPYDVNSYFANWLTYLVPS